MCEVVQTGGQWQQRLQKEEEEERRRKNLAFITIYISALLVDYHVLLLCPSCSLSLCLGGQHPPPHHHHHPTTHLPTHPTPPARTPHMPTCPHFTTLPAPLPHATHYLHTACHTPHLLDSENSVLGMTDMAAPALPPFYYCCLCGTPSLPFCLWAGVEELGTGFP